VGPSRRIAGVRSRSGRPSSPRDLRPLIGIAPITLPGAAVTREKGLGDD
jgi:hypothetical protein